MKYLFALIALLLSPVAVMAQNALPAGTVLPLQLQTGLNASRVKAGQTIRAKVMQNIPGTRIRRGAQVVGHVISASPNRVEMRFDAISLKGGAIPIRTSLRAVASMTEVEEAQVPEGGPYRASPPPEWTTTQVGGEQVYRGGGPVSDGLLTVGKPVPYGVLGRVRNNPPCRAAVAGDNRPQALWVFSTNSCGAYGFSNLTIEDAGRETGTIILTANSGKMNIRSGSVLLRVQGT